MATVLAVPARAADGPRIYVSNEDSGEITLVDPGTGQFLKRIGLGKRPRGIKLAPGGKLLYVARSGSPNSGPDVDESRLPLLERSADGIGDRRPADVQALGHASQQPGSRNFRLVA